MSPAFRRKFVPVGLRKPHDQKEFAAVAFGERFSRTGDSFGDRFGPVFVGSDHVIAVQIDLTKRESTEPG
jgi:hypothetical protein